MLEERWFGFELGYRPSSIKEFRLAPIHLPLVAFSGPSEFNKEVGRMSKDARAWVSL
jgi:hypothetical protein